MTEQPENLPILPGLELPEAAGVFLQKSSSTMGEYSGDIIKANKPELYQAAIELLGRGYSLRNTAKILQINVRSVMAIRDREPDKIATVKRFVSKIYMDVSQLSAEVARDRLLDDPDKVNFKDLMIGGAVATDKALVLAGEATQRIEHVTRPNDDDFESMLQAAKDAGQVIDVKAVDMDMSPEDPTQIEAGENDVAGAQDEAADPAGTGCTNESSDMLSTEMIQNDSKSCVDTSNDTPPPPVDISKADQQAPHSSGDGTRGGGGQ